MIMAGTMIWNVIAAIITGIYVFFLSIQVNSLTTSFFRSGLIMVIVFFVTYVVRWGLGYISGKQPTQSSEMLNENDPGQNEEVSETGEPGNRSDNSEAESQEQFSEQDAERTAQALRNFMNHDKHTE